jgi:hypothetical protein
MEHIRDDFYVTLNSSVGGNTAYDFKNVLAKTVELPGKWECAIVNFYMYCGFNKLSKSDDVIRIFTSDVNIEPRTDFINKLLIKRPSSDNYNLYEHPTDEKPYVDIKLDEDCVNLSIDNVQNHLLNLIKHRFDSDAHQQIPSDEPHAPTPHGRLIFKSPLVAYRPQDNIRDYIDFRRNLLVTNLAVVPGPKNPTGKALDVELAHLKFETTLPMVYLPTKLAQHNGFVSNLFKAGVYFSHFTNLYVKTHTLIYIYSPNLVLPTFYGSSEIPLLLSYPVNSEHANFGHYSMAHPIYVPIREQKLSEVQIQICSEDGQVLSSHFGETEIKLHFRQIS